MSAAAVASSMWLRIAWRRDVERQRAQHHRRGLGPDVAEQLGQVHAAQPGDGFGELEGVAGQEVEEFWGEIGREFRHRDTLVTEVSGESQGRPSSYGARCIDVTPKCS